MKRVSCHEIMLRYCASHAAEPRVCNNCHPGDEIATSDASSPPQSVGLRMEVSGRAILPNTERHVT
jgi:hypothetical protein